MCCGLSNNTVSLKGVVEDHGVQIADGALDLIRIPPHDSEAYHVELTQGERLRFALVASGLIKVRMSAGPRRGITSPLRSESVAAVDQYSLTFCAPNGGEFVVTLENGSRQFVDVAVFLRTVSVRPER